MKPIDLLVEAITDYYRQVGVAPSTSELARFMGKSVDYVQQVLKTMTRETKISNRCGDFMKYGFQEREGTRGFREYEGTRESIKVREYFPTIGHLGATLRKEKA